MTLRRLLRCTLGLGVLASAAWAQNHPVVPPDARAAAQPGAWEQLNIPALPAFVPAEPRRVDLPNGAVLLLQEDHELPFINGFIELHGGSRDLPADKRSLADLYGEVWRTSGTARVNGDALDDLLEAKAAKIETSADVDSSSVSWSSLKGDSDQVLGLAVDLLLHPKFDPAKLQLAQQEEIAGILRRNEDPEGIASREAAKLVYGAGSPYASTPEIAAVLAITPADLQAFHTKTVLPNGMVVGISGDFDAAAMERKLRAALGTLPKGAPPAKPVQEVSGPKPGLYLVDKKDVDQSNVWIVGVGIRRDDPALPGRAHQAGARVQRGRRVWLLV